jgi:hypothetical protein
MHYSFSPASTTPYIRESGAATPFTTVNLADNGMERNDGDLYQSLVMSIFGASLIYSDGILTIAILPM